MTTRSPSIPAIGNAMSFRNSRQRNKIGVAPAGELLKVAYS
jgi:hypothetical protein